MTSVLLAAALDALEVLCLRALPIVIAFACMRGLAVPKKAAVLALYTAGVAALRAARPHALSGVPLAYGYLLFACAAVPVLARALRARRVTSGAAFVVCATALFGLPALFAQPSARGVALLLGWELVLSAYSYAVETSKLPHAPAVPHCLFFLLVNPALVYTQRGQRVASPGLHGPALMRSAIGLGSLLAAALLIEPLYRAARSTDAEPALACLLATGALRFALEYARQAGVASLQIGLMRQLGYAVPERFLNPLAAGGLDDFWRRWNTYVGQWLLRYSFQPLALRAGRGIRDRRMRALAIALAVIATFAATGLLHDAYIYGGAALLETRMLEAFTINGVLVVAWIGCRQLHRTREAVAPGLRVPAVLVSRAGFWLVATSCFAIFWR